MKLFKPLFNMALYLLLSSSFYVLGLTPYEAQIQTQTQPNPVYPPTYNNQPTYTPPIQQGGISTPGGYSQGAYTPNTYNQGSYSGYEYSAPPTYPFSPLILQNQNPFPNQRQQEDIFRANQRPELP